MQAKDQISRLEKGLWFLFIFFVPISLAAHFYSPVLNFSGFYSPYLSHKFFLSDIFYILASFVFFVFGENCRDSGLYKKVMRSSFFVFIFVIASLFYALLFSLNFMNSTLYAFRYAQFLLFAIFLYHEVISYKLLRLAFLSSLIVPMLLGFWHFFFSSSIGAWYFSEPILSLDMKNVAKLELLNIDVLRSYGTFVHPNLFAAFIFVAIAFLVPLISGKAVKSAGLIMAFVLVLLLLLTFSRSAILALLVYVFFSLRRWGNLKWFLAPLIIVFLFILFFSERPGVAERLLMLFQAFEMFLLFPFGVGAGNYTYSLALVPSFILQPWDFQPVHNLFALLLVEWGIVAFIVSIILFLLMLKSKVKLNLPFAFALVILLMTDHYLLSLYQGQFLLAVILGAFLFKKTNVSV